MLSDEAAQAGAEHAAERRIDALRRQLPNLAAAAGLGIAVVIVAGLYLWPTVTGSMGTPGGYDTPKYMWRAALVVDRGLRVLSDPSIAHLAPLPERATLPTLASLVDGAVGVSVLRFMYVLPAIGAVAIGLAAGAFALAGLDEPRWSAGVYAVVVGASVTIARTAIGYSDQLLVDPILIACALAAVLAAARGGSIVPATVLLIVAFATHWIIAGTFVAVLVVVALLLIPVSIVEGRSGTRILDLPSVRLGGVLGCTGAGVAALALLGGVSDLRIGRPPARTLIGKFDRFTAGFRLPWFLPVAALGAVAAWFGDGRALRARRVGALVMVAWAGFGVAGLVAFAWLDVQIPAYRVLITALGLPLLVATALTGTAWLLARRLHVIGAVLGLIVVLVGCAATIFAGWNVWRERVPAFTVEQATQSTVVGRYLQVNPGLPAIVVVTGRSYAKQDRIIRSMLPPDQIARPRIFIGSVADLLAGRPTVRKRVGITQGSLTTFEAVQPLLADDPIILALSAFGRSLDRSMPGTAISPGVTLVRGALPTEPITTTVDVSPSAERVIADLLLVLLLIWVAGLGWAYANLPGRLISAIAVAPAVGIAVLSAVGIVLGMFGVNVAHGWAIPVALAAALLGWLQVLWRRRRGRRSGREPSRTIAT